MSWPSKESDLAQPVIDYLEDLRWEVYQEVQVGAYGSIADLVATQGQLVWVIELKKSLSLELLAQAALWVPRAHFVSVAVPRGRRHTKGHYFARAILDWQGIGQLTVAGPGYTEATVLEHGIIAPRLHRTAQVDRLRDGLCDEQKTYATAGNAEGKRWTPFTRTCHEVRREVERSPGLCMKELVDRISHHYASDKGARCSLATWIQAGTVEGVEARRNGKRLEVFPVEGK